MRQLWAAAAAYSSSADSVHHLRSPGRLCSRWQGAHFIVREGFTLLLHKTVQERERGEAEEDGKTNSTPDRSLGL